MKIFVYLLENRTIYVLNLFTSHIDTCFEIISVTLNKK